MEDKHSTQLQQQKFESAESKKLKKTYCLMASNTLVVETCLKYHNEHPGGNKQLHVDYKPEIL